MVKYLIVFLRIERQQELRSKTYLYDTMEINWITLLGLMAAILTTVGFIPQAVKIIRTKNTRDLSLGMYILLTFGVLSWLSYGILIQDLPVILANGITSVFIVTILLLKIRYK